MNDGTHAEVLHNRDSSKRTDAFYCFKGKSRMNIDEKETIVLEQGDLVILYRDHTCNNLNIKLSNHDDDSTATIIKVSIFY
jgi:uncharacterized cupin superfamily protein